MNSEKELCLNIGKLVVPYILSNSKRAKHIRLVMNMSGLKVVKPIKESIYEVKKVLEEKSNWIYKHYTEFQDRKTVEYKREWESGEIVLLKGIQYNIIILPHKKKAILINFNGIRFEIFINDTFNEYERKTHIENAFKKWYMKTAYETLKERLDHYCKLTGLVYNNLRVKEQKTCWGSCSKKRNLNFNWKLILSPQWVMDYVVIHEICHLKHLNHSKEYWVMVEMYMASYKKAQEWLKKNGSGLAL